MASSSSSSHSAAAPSPVLWSHIQVDEKQRAHERDAISDLEQFQQPCSWFSSPNGCRQAERCLLEHVAGGRPIGASVTAAQASSRAQSSASVATQPKAKASKGKGAQRKGAQPLSQSVQAARLAVRSLAFSNNCYLADKLQPNDVNVGLETSVLPFRQSDRCTFQLLFGEANNEDGAPQLCLISGPCTQRAGGSPFKRPAAESFPWQGAMNLLGGQAVLRLAHGDGCPVMWLPSARLAIHLLELCGELEMSVQERFNIILGRPAAAPANEETWRHYRQLHWVELRMLLDCIHSDDRSAPVATTGGASIPLAESWMHALRQPPLLNHLELMQRDAEVTASQRLFEAVHATDTIEHSAASTANAAEQQATISFHCYSSPTLKPVDGASFQSAAVIAFRRSGSRVELLFRRSCATLQAAPDHPTPLADLSLAGGLRVQKSSSAYTAAHLFWRAKAAPLAAQIGIPTEVELRQRLQQGPVMWEPTIRSVLYFLQLAGANSEASDVTAPAVAAEATTQLCWIELATLIRFLDKGFQRRRTIDHDCADAVRTTAGGAATMSSPTVCILRRPPLLAALDQLLRDSSPDGALAFEDICMGREARARVMTDMYSKSQSAVDLGSESELAETCHSSAPAPPSEPAHSHEAKKAPRPLSTLSFRVASVLAYRRTPHSAVQVLMGRHNDFAGARKAGRLGLFAGNIEMGESSAQPAAKKMWEECGGLLDRQLLVLRVESSDFVWTSDFKYVVHLVELQSDEELAICERYAAAQTAASVSASAIAADSTQRHPGNCNPADGGRRQARMRDLHWIDLAELLRFLATQPRRTQQQQSVSDDPLTTTTGLQCCVYSFAVSTMNNSGVHKRLKHLLQRGGLAAPRS